MEQASFLLPEDSSKVDWAPTFDAAESRLDAFLPRAGSAYAKGRNFDLGTDNRSNVSALSPWVRCRLICEDHIIDRVLGLHDVRDADKFIQEVFWRGYFKGWLEQRPAVWQSYKQNLLQHISVMEKDGALAQRYDEAISGRTGIACFDAWSNELIETGYLHNHARMWYASIWIFTLKLPWELGADFFLRHLLDGDPASNTCSWRWVGGLHTIGKTYLARADNIAKFTRGRFSPSGELAIEAQALEERLKVTRAPVLFEDANVFGLRAGLLVTNEDCSAHQLTELVAIETSLVLGAFTPRSVMPPSEHIVAFEEGASNATHSALMSKTEVQCELTYTPDWSSAIKNWADANELDVIVTPQLPIGPIKKRLFNAISDLSTPLVQIPRSYDREVWPHAKAGFFGLKKKIPTILDTLANASIFDI